MSELKPCPWCGEKRKKNIIHQSFIGDYKVQHECGLVMICGRKIYKSEDDAIRAWNRRADNER